MLEFYVRYTDESNDERLNKRQWNYLRFIIHYRNHLKNDRLGTIIKISKNGQKRLEER